MGFPTEKPEKASKCVKELSPNPTMSLLKEGESLNLLLKEAVIYNFVLIAPGEGNREMRKGTTCFSFLTRRSSCRERVKGDRKLQPLPHPHT